MSCGICGSEFTENEDICYSKCKPDHKFHNVCLIDSKNSLKCSVCVKPKTAECQLVKEKFQKLSETNELVCNKCKAAFTDMEKHLFCGACKQYLHLSCSTLLKCNKCSGNLRPGFTKIPKKKFKITLRNVINANGRGELIDVTGSMTEKELFQKAAEMFDIKDFMMNFQSHLLNEKGTNTLQKCGIREGEIINLVSRTRGGRK